MFSWLKILILVKKQSNLIEVPKSSEIQVEQLLKTNIQAGLLGKKEHMDQIYVSPSKNGKMLGRPWWSSG